VIDRLLRERLALHAAIEDKPVDRVVLRDVYAQKYRHVPLPQLPSLVCSARAIRSIHRALGGPMRTALRVV
jgi:hypothetical protein